jgi:hypothetical protein
MEETPTPFKPTNFKEEIEQEKSRESNQYD